MTIRKAFTSGAAVVACGLLVASPVPAAARAQDATALYPKNCVVSHEPVGKVAVMPV
jgi:hypothetical protein